MTPEEKKNRYPKWRVARELARCKHPNIEKMKRYIEQTHMKKVDNLAYPEAVELIHMGEDSVDGMYDAISLAFDYGKAKGYRVAKAERRAAV